MNRYDTVLVAASLDSRDATTLQHAARFARAASIRKLWITHVGPPGNYPAELVQEFPDLRAAAADEIEQQLRQTFHEQADAFPDEARVHYTARQESLLAGIVRLASQKAADVLFLGHKVGDDDDPLHDAVASILRKSPCSVFVVPQDASPDYRHILVPLEFSDRDYETLDVAIMLASSVQGARITVQNVYAVPTGYGKTGRSFDAFAESMRGLAERQWREFAAKFDFRGTPTQIRFDLAHHIPKSILRAAAEMDVDLIVIGSHGRTGPSGVLLGHVADSVCARTTRPCLCVKRKGEVVTLMHAVLQLFDFE